MAESEDVKPAQATINISIKEGDNAPIVFKVKRSIKFEKIFSAFENKKGAAPGTNKFTLNGEELENADTPDEKEISEGDQIDAVIKQVRGASAA